MSDSNASPGGQYDKFYLRQNPASAAAFARKAKGYHRKIGSLLDGCSSALDLGCGTGLLSHYLVGRGMDVVGVDINAPLLEIARQNVKAPFVQVDVCQYVAQADRKFDVIFLLNLLEHIPPAQAGEFLAGVCRCLNEGGFAVVRAPNFSALTGPAHFYQDPTHCLPLTEESLQHLARQAGFSRVEHCDQFAMQRIGGKVRAVLNWLLHRYVFWLSGGGRPRVYYRNLYCRLVK